MQAEAPPTISRPYYVVQQTSIMWNYTDSNPQWYEDKEKFKNNVILFYSRKLCKATVTIIKCGNQSCIATWYFIFTFVLLLALLLFLYLHRASQFFLRGVQVKLWECEVPWERVPYLSALEVCSQWAAIQIHVYLYLYLYLPTFPALFSRVDGTEPCQSWTRHGAVINA